MKNLYLALTRGEKSNFLLRAEDEKAAWVRARGIAREGGLGTIYAVWRVYEDFTDMEDQKIGGSEQ